MHMTSLPMTTTSPTAATTSRRKKAATPALAQLPEEPWGWKLKRAREKYAHMTLDDAVESLARYMPAHGTTVSRLEQLDAKPLGRARSRARMMAYLLVLTYGLDPAQFDLDGDDIPEGIRELVGRDLGFPSTRWYGREPRPRSNSPDHRPAA